MRLLIILCLSPLFIVAQTQQLNEAVGKMEKDAQFKYATIALMVKDASTGKTVYEKNANLGVSPASSLKVVTSATAFSLLGKDFRFTTTLSLIPSPDNGKEALLITGWGDPTFGSDRWKQTDGEVIFQSVQTFLQKNKVNTLPGGIFISNLNFTYQPVPDGWVWEDMGNYFGAGAWGLNWKENVFEIDLQPGRDAGDPVTVLATRPYWMKDKLTSFVTTEAKGSGDQSIVYSAPYHDDIFMTGTIPAGGKFTVKAAMPDPANIFGRELKEFLEKSKISCGPVETSADRLRLGKPLAFDAGKEASHLYSPSLDSFNYWFMNKSINLYGESLIKTLALRQKLEASTENGIEVARNFWQAKGIEKAALKMVDGSGLSPSNRITASALVSVMEYAQTQPWFNSFLHALPEMNGMKLKSGYMGGVRSYTGMVTSKTGKKYWVAFVINNFDGSPSAVRQKMWQVLDLLL